MFVDGEDSLVGSWFMEFRCYQFLHSKHYTIFATNSYGSAAQDVDIIDDPLPYQSVMHHTISMNTPAVFHCFHGILDLKNSTIW